MNSAAIEQVRAPETTGDVTCDVITFISQSPCARAESEWPHLLSKHGGPQLDKLALVEAAVLTHGWTLDKTVDRPDRESLDVVEAAVLVLVEHLDEVARHLLVEAHLLLYDGHHFLGTQHAVAVLVESVETRRYFFMAVYTTHARYMDGLDWVRLACCTKEI